MRLTKGPRRHGSVLPLLTISLVALCGFVALAVDVGLMVVARTQAQNAADAAAMAGARSIDGSPSGNVANATLNAQAAAAANTVLGKSVQTSEVTIRHGAYHYDPTAQKFSPQFPPQAPDNYNLTQATVTRTSATAFARVFGLSAFNVSATAVAAHRPRDCCIVLDYSGSMNNESDLWNNESYLGTVNNSPNNTDPVVPQFGPYSSSAATLVCVSTDPRVGKCNITQPVLGIPPLVNDFYQNAIGASPVPAFSPAAYTNLYTPPAGDQFLSKFGSTGSPPTFAVTVQDVTNSTSQLPLKQAGAAGGYDRNNFKGYTLGPGYWGITFFIWPPYPEDPNNAAENGSQPGKFHFDWRRRFFLKPGGSYPNFGGPVDDNTLLWDSTGSWKDPKDNKGTNYVINYAAILKWIKTCPNNPFPPQLRAGNILFYDQIPDDVPASAYNYGATSNPNAQITDPNQRFWKEYIDYALGVWTDPYATPSSITGSNRSSGSTHIQRPGNPACSIGPDFTWGTVQISAPKQYPGYSFNYVAPADNPKRPRHRCWFGPLTMIQFMSDTGLLPGTAHDISLYVAKLGIAGALTDIQTNHPNDLVSMILFSRPQYTNDPPGTGSFNQAQFALSRDYSGMINALWYPPNVGPNSPAAGPTLDCRPWDANGIQTPRAHSDFNANTATSYGFMLAYNQFSGSGALRSQLVNNQAAGGLGRKGAQRLVILETDGMANQDSLPQAWFTNGGANNSYYNILPGQTVNGGGFNQTNLMEIVQAICNKADGTPGNASPYTPNPGYPGYATSNKPVLIHTLAFGAIFEAPCTEQTNSVALLQLISQTGGTTFPSSATDPANGYKWIIGTLQQRQDKLRQAFNKIMDDGVSVVMVK